MIRNSLDIYASLIVHLSLWPLRVLILGYFINDIKNDIKNDIRNDIRYIYLNRRTTCWTVGAVASISTVPVCLPLLRYSIQQVSY